jgi:hypothetical protein
MEWRKGFLSEPKPRKPPRRKANALPDEAFLPAETYDLVDDDGAPPRPPRPPLLVLSGLTFWRARARAWMIRSAHTVHAP